MTETEILHELESLGSEQTRKTYRRHGIAGEMYGVSYANLGALHKRLKTNHDLAEQLWASGNHDARVLATMIVDPARLTDGQLDAWAKDLQNYGLTDAFSRMAGRSPLARKKMEKWTHSKHEWIGSAGWNMLGQLSMSDSDLPDSFFEAYLPIIGRDIHKGKNRVRYAMNNALIAIGTRSPALRKKALAAAKRIGKVEVDHGETSCKTPDASTYILKVAQRKAQTTRG